MGISKVIVQLRAALKALEAVVRRKPKPVPRPAPKPKPPLKPPVAKAVVMYDTIEVAQVPPHPQAVAGYVGGRWQTFKPLVKKFPDAHHLSIAIAASEDADCLDIENGDATPDQAPVWVRRQHARGISRPVVYASLSAMPAVLSRLAGDHIPRQQVRVWTAHYNGKAHLCTSACGYGLGTTADATQWTDKALGRNLDESLCSPTFFSTGGH